MSTELERQKQLIRDELEKLKYEFKIDLPKKIAEARAYGDLKENAEYHAARERQSFVKARIAQLNDQLGKLNEIKIDNVPEDKIAFGSSVTIVDCDSDDRIEFFFVSPHEVNPAEGKISLSSPIGQALQGRTVGEKVEAQIPAGKRTYYVERLTTVHGKTIEKPYSE